MQNDWPEYFQPDVVKDAFGAGKLSSFCIALEAWRRGLAVSLKHPNLYYFDVSDGERTISFNNSMPSPLTTESAYQLVETKNRATERLRSKGIVAPTSVPFDAQVQDFDDVLETAENFGFPVVIKPIRGSKGNGVIAGIRDKSELRAAHDWLVNSYGTRRFIVENFFEGGDHRVYVVGQHAVSAGLKHPAHVVGDGHHSIKELIRLKNDLKSRNPFQSNSPIRPDFEVDSAIARLGYTYEDVPDENVEIRLRNKANVSAGGDFSDVTDRLPAHIIEAAVKSLAAIPGLAAAGVDVLYDPSKPIGQDYVILELNARAHIGLNMYPTYGVGADVPKAILDAYFPSSRRLDIPDLKRITIDLENALVPLIDGSVDEVKLRPLPDHGIPARRTLRFSSVGRLKNSQRRKIMRAGRSFAVLGHVNCSRGSAVVCGEKKPVEQFRARLSEILSREVSFAEDWTGPVKVSFRLDD